MTEKAKRKITKFNFESEGAHLSLVDSAANLQEVLVMKALKEPQENSTSSVNNQDENVVKTEDNPIKPEEEVTKMSEENKVDQNDIQAMINKALKDQEGEIRKSIAAEYEEVSKATTAELEILKAKEEAREEKAFIAKAAEFKEHLGEDPADKVELLAKALRKMEGDADMKAATDLLKSLKDTVENSALMQEVGTTTVEKNMDQTEGDRMVQKMVKEDGMSESSAYAKLLVERPELF